MWLTGPIAVLVAIAAGVGFFSYDIYRDAPVNAAQAVGQDLITLVVAHPTLVISAILALRGSRRAHLVWLGVVKAVSIFLGVVAFVFYSMWLSEDVPALLAGGVPQGVIDGEAPTDIVHVLDMAWILPAMVLTAIWLWRGRALAYVLSGTLLSILSLLVLAIMSMIVFQILYGVATAVGIAVVLGVVFSISLGMLVWYLRGLKEQ